MEKKEIKQIIGIIMLCGLVVIILEAYLISYTHFERVSCVAFPTWLYILVPELIWGLVIAIIQTIFLFEIVPILYFKHIKKAEKEKEF